MTNILFRVRKVLKYLNKNRPRCLWPRSNEMLSMKIYSAKVWLIIMTSSMNHLFRCHGRGKDLQANSRTHASWCDWHSKLDGYQSLPGMTHHILLISNDVIILVTHQPWFGQAAIRMAPLLLGLDQWGYWIPSGIPPSPTRDCSGYNEEAGQDCR